MRNICNYTFWIFSVIVFWAFYEYGKKSTKALGLVKEANKDEVKISEVMSSQAFMILQTVKDHREFSRKVPEGGAITLQSSPPGRWRRCRPGVPASAATCGAARGPRRGSTA